MPTRMMIILEASTTWTCLQMLVIRRLGTHCCIKLWWGMPETSVHFAGQVHPAVISRVRWHGLARSVAGVQTC